jgi:hypothetical protein
LDLREASYDVAFDFETWQIAFVSLQHPEVFVESRSSENRVMCPAEKELSIFEA